MADLELFEAERPRLFAIAYRMLGSASEAEDVLQDTWMRLNGAATDDIRSPSAFAATVVTRLCLDRLKSARATRERYVGPWLPEPVLTGDEETPDVLVERAESVTMAFLVLLETLAPEERAVFLLKEVFEYEHAEIAAMLGLSTANSRQLFHRAKEKIRATPAKRQAHEDRRRVADQFAQALLSGDASSLTQLLATDVTFVSDGGGKVPASLRPLYGRDQVLNLLLGLRRTAYRTGQAARATFHMTDVNSEPALILRIDGRLETVFILTVVNGVLTNIHVMRNPEKLAYLDRQLRTIM